MFLKNNELEMLKSAVKNQKLEDFQKRLQRMGDVSKLKSDDECPFLTFLLEKKNLPLGYLQAALAAGMDPNYVEDGYFHPLEIVLESCGDDSRGETQDDKALEKLNLLLSYRANPNAIGARETFPLTDLCFVKASYNNGPRDKAINLLLKYGANPFLKDTSGQNTIEWAQKKNDKRMLTLLKESPMIQSMIVRKVIKTK